MIDSSSVLFEPRVYLVSSQKIEPGLQTFLDDEGFPDWTTDAASPAEMLPEVGGRLCYLSYGAPRPGGNKAYLDHIIEVGHTSVLEHAVWSVIITGISRSLTHELVRTRIGISPSQLSQRFVDESSCRFVVPPKIHNNVRQALIWHELNKDSPTAPDAYTQLGLDWLESVGYAKETYCKLADSLMVEIDREHPHLPKTDRRKMARQTARSVLPECTETKIYLTGNARAWRHFFTLRASRHADAEIRILACRILELLKGKSSNLFNDFSRVDLPDGTYEYVLGGSSDA